MGIARAYQEYRNRIYAKDAILLCLTLLIDKPKTPFALTHTHIVAHIRATHSRSQQKDRSLNSFNVAWSRTFLFYFTQFFFSSNDRSHMQNIVILLIDSIWRSNVYVLRIITAAQRRPAHTTTAICICLIYLLWLLNIITRRKWMKLHNHWW